MYARVVCVALLAVASESTLHHLERISKLKHELEPIHITSQLNEKIFIPAPMLNSETIYYLSNPNGDTSKLNLKILDGRNYTKNEISEIVIKPKKYGIFGVNNRCKEFFIKGSLQENFTIGPLSEEDHGNWVLSAFYVENGEWIEVYQVITIEIIESIPIIPKKSILKNGQDFKPRFAYPIEEIQSCEIVPPRSTFDRYFDRDKEYLDHCGFHITNLTKDDEGVWKIIGVGKIVYESQVYLEINDIL